ncbi:MAG: transposase family protein [Solirubrobacteraceae bacterium]
MGIPSDYRFVAVVGKRLRHLFPVIPTRDAFHKRRLRLSGQIEALIAHFARQSPGFFDDLLLVDSTPVECARSRQTVKRGGASSLAEVLTDAADYGYCASTAHLVARPVNSLVYASGVLPV